jgi:septal ring factor EnvC (AmiA/AmiB activator)
MAELDRDNVVLREMARPHKTDRRRIESVVSRLEELLKQERNKEGRLAGMVARSFGGANSDKNESHPEPVPAGIVGQLEGLMDRLL